MSDTTHDGSGTIELMRGSHRSMRCSHAQSSLHFRPSLVNPHLEGNGHNEDILTKADQGTVPADYSRDHVEIKAPAGTIVAFQNGVWHRCVLRTSWQPTLFALFCLP